MTSSPRTPDPSGPADEPRAEAPKARLSLTQVVASALAAVSATVLMSFFGVAGTIIGAGLASIVTVIGNFLWTRSIEKTHEQLKPVVTQLASKSRRTTETSRGTVVTVADAGGGTTVETDVAAESAVPSPPDDGDVPPDDGATGPQGSAEEPAEEPRNAWLRFVEKHGTKKVLAVSAAALFVVVMGVVLVIELAIGKPLSDAVRGQEGSGTSISRSSSDHGGSTPEPTPSSPAEDPANVPGTDQGTDDPATGTTDGTTDTPTQEPTPDTTGGTDSGKDPMTGDGTDGTTDNPTDGTGGGTDSGTSGGSDGGTDDGTSGGTTGDGTTDGGDTSGGTDTGSGTGSTDAEPGAGTSSGGSAQEGATPTPTPAS
ncbi:MULTISPECIES: hypothetical protein [unclassified Isoptericola]|uniref:hypothetical protein n=1 Tax=unclassified Isoptericola TaxID=2623355 RepID=UPI0036632A29